MSTTTNDVSNASVFEPVTFPHGPAMPNRLMLAPLTNQQSHADGTLSDEEHRWLTMRALGGFGLTMTCAASVQAVGVGFSGQLGIHDDAHIPGLTRLACDIKMAGSMAIVQLHHAGNRSPREITGTTPLCPSDDAETGARAMTNDEVHEMIGAFVSAARRARDAGFDGVELHGAHGYLLCQFLSAELNHRTDEFGGSLENRARPLFAIIEGVRRECGDDFHVGVRLSPERFGMRLDEIREVFLRLVSEGRIDMIDMSLWDCFKNANEEGWADQRLIDIFTALDRGDVRLAVAGKLYSAATVREALGAGADIAVIGRAGITNHDFPRGMRNDPNFEMRPRPVPAQTLRDEGLSEIFVDYMRNWKGFVGD
ncbi:MAG: NADH:flavin oxidoreductase [Actinobacteria bacterium]|nr:NADH:flavin oxidoreductase [Actinomycetota bacterium]